MENIPDIHWLVVWNMFYVSSGNDHPNWVIGFRGVGFNHQLVHVYNPYQPYVYVYYIYIYIYSKYITIYVLHIPQDDWAAIPPTSSCSLKFLKDWTSKCWVESSIRWQNFILLWCVRAPKDATWMGQNLELPCITMWPAKLPSGELT